MKTIEVLQRIQSLYSKGVQSDDSRLSNRHIYNKALTVRARLITNLAKQRQKLSYITYQILPCVELIEAPIHECPIVPMNCKVLRSKYPIPEILTDKDAYLIEFVTTLDGKKKFDYTTWNGASAQKGNRYTKTLSNYYFKNGYLYLTHNMNLEVIVISAIFSDFIAAINFPSYCTSTVTDCTSPLYRDFPLDMDSTELLIGIVANELLEKFTQATEDKISNSSDDTASIIRASNTQNYKQDA